MLMEYSFAEVEVTLPVVLGHIMFSCTDVVAHIEMLGVVDGWLFFGGKSLHAIQPVRCSCVVCTQVLSPRVGPLVILCTGYIDMTRSYQGQ